MDDLDVRASDLLQANCIVWVEGPSDRIYVNRWINLWSNGKLLEGFHYQTVFYGGRLLAHLHAVSDEEATGVSILRTNRKCVLLMDSDKRAKQSRLNKTKRRLKSEVDRIGGLSWITCGKEIENYLPASAIAAVVEVQAASQIDKFQDFPEYLEALKGGEGKRFRKQKALFAERIVPHLSLENCRSVLDWDMQLSDLCKFISSCNQSEDIA